MIGLTIIEPKSTNKVVIIGYPGSGKTTFYREMIQRVEYNEHFKTHTDSYMKYGYKNMLYKIIEDLKGKEKYVVEGVQGYRLLRKIAELKLVDMKPDVVIVCKTMRLVSAKHQTMIKGLDTIWRRYLELEKDPPLISEYWN